MHTVDYHTAAATSYHYFHQLPLFRQQAQPAVLFRFPCCKFNLKTVADQDSGAEVDLLDPVLTGYVLQMI